MKAIILLVATMFSSFTMAQWTKQDAVYYSVLNETCIDSICSTSKEDIKIYFNPREQSILISDKKYLLIKMETSTSSEMIYEATSVETGDFSYVKIGRLNGTVTVESYSDSGVKTVVSYSCHRVKQVSNY
jgi:predicted P-loop ATPase/GTPase